MAEGFFPKASFYAFEPSPTNFPILRTKLPGSHFHHQNLALAQEAGTIPFKDYGPGSPLNTTLLQSAIHDSKEPAKILQVPAETGDAFCAQEKIAEVDFLKIDVEGAEHLVLQGFTRMLRHSAIGVIQFEYGYANGDAHFLMKDFFLLFSSFGYHVAKVRKGPLHFGPFQYEMNDFNSGPNYLAVAGTRPEILQALAR